MTDLTLRCRCGALTGHLAARSAKAGTHLVCHCRDCRAFQVALGRPDPGAAEGVSILQISPAGLRIDGQMACLRLSPRGPFRFYAPCCGTPIATTMTRPLVPFAGLLTAMFVEDGKLRPVRAHAHITGPDGRVTHRHIGRVARAIASNAIGAYLRGEARLTPFFDAATGQPTVTPEIIDKTCKAAIYAQL